MTSTDITADIISFWFPNDKFQDFWFDQTVDDYIEKKYKNLVDNPFLMLLLDKWTKKEDLIAKIIVLDQFTRNIYRRDGEKDIKKRNDSIALNIALDLLKNNKDLTYPPNQRIFILLPLRHQKNELLLDKVMDRLKLYSYHPIFERFKIATVKSYINLTDNIQIYNEYKEDIQKPIYDNYIHDEKCQYYDNIDMKNKENIISENLYKTLNNFTTKKIGVSLSGGIDSMVICYILNKIKKSPAIHIKYNNREESKIETEFIINWCKYYNIPLIVREVKFKRNDIDRALYEKVTKDIRFALYKFAIDKYDLDGICLGHHRDDISENVFMNIMKGESVLNLSGMTDKCTINNINIYRPLLKHIKQDIYNFADKFGIYYMKDTTPDWSCRGTYRKKINPLITKQFGYIDNHLFNIGQESDMWNNMIHKKIIKPIIDKAIISADGFTIPFEDDLTDAVWMEILQPLYYKIGIRTKISKPCLLQFMNWLKRNNGTKCKMYIIISRKDNLLTFKK